MKLGTFVCQGGFCPVVGWIVACRGDLLYQRERSWKIRRSAKVRYYRSRGHFWEGSKVNSGNIFIKPSAKVPGQVPTCICHTCQFFCWSCPVTQQLLGMTNLQVQVQICFWIWGSEPGGSVLEINPQQSRGCPYTLTHSYIFTLQHFFLSKESQDLQRRMIPAAWQTCACGWRLSDEPKSCIPISSDQTTFFYLSQ